MTRAILRITAEDLETGDKQVTEIPAGEYVVLTTEPCHVDGIQAYPQKGTYIVTIKGRTAKNGGQGGDG